MMLDAGCARGALEGAAPACTLVPAAGTSRHLFWILPDLDLDPYIRLDTVHVQGPPNQIVPFGAVCHSGSPSATFCASQSALPVPATPSPGTMSNGFRSKGPVLELVTVDR